MLMKDLFQSKPVPREPRTIWRYLSALILLFTFAIGQMWGAASSVIPSSPDYKDISTVATSGTYTFTCSSSNITGAASATSSWIGWYSTNSSFKEYDKLGSATCMGEQTKIPNLKYDKVYFYVSNCTSFEIQAWGNGDNRHVNYSYQATDAASATADSFTSANNTTCASSGEIALNASKSYEIIVWNDASEEIGVTYMVFNTSTGGGGCTADPAAPTAFAAGSITEDGVTFTITDDANAGKYAIYYSTSSTAPVATTAASATSTAKSKAITGLTASTKYYAWVRSVCDDSHKSDWVALTGGFFTTLSGPRDLYKINMTATSETNMPHGQKVELTSTYGIVTGGYADLYNKHASDDSKLKVNSSGITFTGGDPCVILYLNEPLHVGDKIEFTSSNTNQIKIGVVDNKDQTLVTTSNKSYTVASEGLAGKQVIYLWRVSSTTYIKTLTISTTAELPTFRTVTFDPNYTGSQSFTRTPADGAKIVYIPKDPENGTSEFEGWFEGSAATAFDFSTAITADKTLTAHWSAPVTKHKVAYYDGSTKVGEEEVVENASPVNYANYQAKALHSFTNWKNNADAVIDPASLVVTKDTALYAHWAKVYIAQDANYVFENTTTVGTAPNAITVTKDNNPNAIAADSRIDNMWLSAMSVKLEDGTYSGSGDDFYGWKINTSGATIRFYVENDCRVTVTVGNLTSGLKITYTGKSAAEEATTALTAKQANNYDVKGGTLVTLTTAGGSTVTLKGIAVGEIPAQSDDASLSDLTLKYGTAEAATISGFASTKQIYYVEAPYGTAKADLPIVGATATDATNALVTINQAKDREDWKTVIRVQAEDRIEAHDMYYEVRFKVQPKLGVEIIKAVTTTANDGDATGYIGGTYKNTKTGNAVKLDKNNHFGLVIAANNAFQEGDIFAMNITAAAGGNMGTMKIYESTDATEPLFESTEIGTVGMNYWTLPASVNGKTSLYIKRGGGDDWNPTFSSIAVYRLMAPFIEEFAIEGVEDFVIDQENKTITASVANSFDVTALEPTVKYWGNGGGAIDKTGARDFTNPVTYTVSSAYAEDATGDYAPVIYTVTINKVAPSVEPTITTQPTGANYYEGATIAALTVVAESAEGELSYQWQVKNGNNYEDIEGANAASYTPAVSAIGSYIYRVVVTNTEDSKPATSVNSEDAIIVIAADPACATFVTIPAESPYRYVNSGEWTLFNANSSGRRDDSNTFVNNANDYENNTINGFAKQRCSIIFDKDMKQVRFYTNNSSTGRNWASSNPVQVSADADKFLGIEEGNPSYTVYAASTSMEKYAESDYKIILKADGEFVAGKVYLFSFSNSVTIFKICAIEADPKAEAPVFSGTLSDEAICPGNSFATLDATASPVTSYAWYKDDEVIENAEAATYTPTEAGTYYCIATNSAAGYRDNSTKSAEAVLSVNVTTAITAHADAIGDVDAEKAVSVTAEGTNLSYQWQACDENGVVTDATVLGTTASMNVTIAAETKYYLATVTGACGVETQVVVVREWHEVAQADVTESTTWDWTKSCWDGHANVELANTSVEELMANVNSSVVNNNEFRSDMLVVRGQYAWRNESGKKYFQGYSVKFHTTVPGLVKVTYRGTGKSKNVILSIGDYTAPEYAGDYTTVQAFVPAGDVVINGIGGEGNENGMVRIKEIVFHAPDYTRNVSNKIGTLCVDHNVPAGQYFGATFYQIAGRNATYPDKLDFDQVAPDEELKAGEPYIFQSTTGRIDLFYGETEKTEPVVVNGMHGLLANGHLDITDDNKLDILYISDNKLHNCSNLVGAGLDLVINRAYIVMSEVDASETLAPGRTRMTIGGSGAPQIATGVDNLNESETPVKVLINGQIFILRGEKMYDATGRLVK